MTDNEGVYRCGYLVDSESPVEQISPDITTLHEIFMRGLKISGDGPCLWRRLSAKQPYHSMKYSEVLEQSRKFGSTLIGKLNHKAGNETRIGIYSKNCVEWFLTAMACIQYSMVIVPLYDTLGPEAVKFIIEHCELSSIVVSDSEKAKKLLSANIECVKNIILIDTTNIGEVINLVTGQVKVNIYAFQDLVSQGDEYSSEIVLPKPDDIYIICFTSGTTGSPKGVILTHRNLNANISAYHFMLKTFLPDLVTPHQVEISYLPLAHIAEQLGHWCMFVIGGSVGYYSGNIMELSNDMQDLRPTVFPSVPRVLNRLYDRIQETVKHKNFLARAIFRLAYQQKLSLLKKGITTTDSIWDWIVFSKIQKLLGGRVQLVGVGSAPISVKVLEACRVVFGFILVEAYGQTECGGIATTTWPDEKNGGHCGSPFGCTLLKLADVPELDYYADKGKGEIMVKGSHVAQGYFKDPEKTAELFDDQGFLHTGDIGEILPNGTIKLIDRKKNIFKLAQGEYVAPDKIESVYSCAPCVQQIFVDGDSLERFLVAIVVPVESMMKNWFRENFGDSEKPYKEILTMKEAKDYVLNELQKIGKENNLNSIEQVKAVHLTCEAFSMENGLLTPTMKIKRAQLRKLYRQKINDLYKTFACKNVGF
ncbi:unnamed protein product [Dracunculus medinensis]|uniref:Long-chain-fatty-acid--CoA ligase n=1 Tax=Dracunculus medinensis TaxID=318479 RepID=A0A158Q539_DRAME|nr:unnamed protein product [Dracunculus medinensis]